MNDFIEQLPEQLQLDQLPLIGEAWIYHVFAVVLASLVTAYIAKRVLDHMQKRAEKTRNIWDDALVDAIAAAVSDLRAFMSSKSTTHAVSCNFLEIFSKS